MAASPVLADSSFYIRLMREDRDPLRSLALATASRDLAIYGVMRCEVAREIREPGLLRTLQQAWNVMINVPTDKRLWEDVEVTTWQLDCTGIVLPLSDVIIGCSARRIGAVVLTFDEHFQKIPGVRAVNRLDV